jgi:arginase
MPALDGVRDLRRVADVVRATADRVATIASSGRLPLVLGGDCTITLGVVAGLAQHVDVGLLYFDGDADLGLPGTSASGVADTMGMTHLLGGGRDELSRIGPRHPLVPASQVVLFGFDPHELDTAQWTSLNAHRLTAFTAPEVRAAPVATATTARRQLEEQAESFLVHLDVDVLDTGLFPLANFPHFGGLSLEEMAEGLEVLCDSPRLAGLVVTEVNPDHDPDHDLLERLVDVVASALG